MSHVDTLQIYERLRKADLPESAAREIAEVINEVVEERLVSRQHFDLKMKEIEARFKELEAQIKEVEARIIKWTIGIVLSVATLQAAIIVTLIKVL